MGLNAAVEKYITPRLKYLVPATFLAGTAVMWVSYKLYFQTASKRRKYLRNESDADQLWTLEHPEKNKLGPSG